MEDGSFVVISYCDATRVLLDHVIPGLENARTDSSWMYRRAWGRSAREPGDWRAESVFRRPSLIAVSALFWCLEF
ncbi:hypothetical protein K1719_010204 [Acacia pycnantha]|nr:hypothetical protein K1719_010129 [Acacia pycnantha]KAI9118759.1 hypothetical protein K1719_010204 [Acacia pycnantha]